MLRHAQCVACSESKIIIPTQTSRAKSTSQQTDGNMPQTYGDLPAKARAARAVHSATSHQGHKGPESVLNSVVDYDSHVDSFMPMLLVSHECKGLECLQYHVLVGLGSWGSCRGDALSSARGTQDATACNSS